MVFIRLALVGLLISASEAEGRNRYHGNGEAGLSEETKKFWFKYFEKGEDSSLTHTPTNPPTKQPTLRPTQSPVPPTTTTDPTAAPTVVDTARPSASPVTNPPTMVDGTPAPTNTPTLRPTSGPTAPPVTSPPTGVDDTPVPTKAPTPDPTMTPTVSPTRSPTASPVETTDPPTGITPTTRAPTRAPVPDPTSEPTRAPVPDPTDEPTRAPVPDPTPVPTRAPVPDPTNEPTRAPVPDPTPVPTRVPVSTPAPVPPGGRQPFCVSVSSEPLGENGDSIFGRIGAGFGPTTCGFPLYPGTIGEQERNYAEIGPFFNPNSDPLCVTVDVDMGTCVSSAGNTLVHTTAFTSFNPDDIGQNYLGDVGATDDFFQFQFFAPAMQEFYIVGQQILDIVAPDNGTGCTFSVIVRDASCPP